jgi:hypothetical protein
VKNLPHAEVIDLAKARWAALHAFDLADETWLDLFDTYKAGSILQGIRLTSKTRDTRPEIIYQSLLHWIRINESNATSINRPKQLAQK